MGFLSSRSSETHGGKTDRNPPITTQRSWNIMGCNPTLGERTRVMHLAGGNWGDSHRRRGSRERRRSRPGLSLKMARCVQGRAQDAQETEGRGWSIPGREEGKLQGMGQPGHTSVLGAVGEPPEDFTRGSGTAPVVLGRKLATLNLNWCRKKPTPSSLLSPGGQGCYIAAAVLLLVQVHQACICQLLCKVTPVNYLERDPQERQRCHF